MNENLFASPPRGRGEYEHSTPSTQPLFGSQPLRLSNGQDENYNAWGILIGQGCLSGFSVGKFNVILQLAHKNVTEAFFLPDLTDPLTIFGRPTSKMAGIDNFRSIPKACLGDLWTCISRVHFSIRRQGQAAAIQNHGSCGTYINGECIEDNDWHYLEEGSFISTLPNMESKFIGNPFKNPN